MKCSTSTWNIRLPFFSFIRSSHKRRRIKGIRLTRVFTKRKHVLSCKASHCQASQRLKANTISKDDLKAYINSKSATPNNLTRARTFELIDQTANAFIGENILDFKTDQSLTTKSCLGTKYDPKALKVKPKPVSFVGQEDKTHLEAILSNTST